MPNDVSMASCEKTMVREVIDNIQQQKRLVVEEVTSDGCAALAKTINDLNNEHNTSMPHTLCYKPKKKSVHKSLDKNQTRLENARRYR